MKYSMMNRRMFLQGAGSLLAIPFLPSLVRAQTASTHPFFVIVPMRECFDRYRTWSLNKSVGYTQLDTETKERSLLQLASMDGRISEILHAGWNPYLDKMNMFTHLSMYSSSNLHSETVMGCADNRGSGPFFSIDYLIRNKLKAQGFNPALDLLQINFQSSLFSDYTRLSHWGNEKRAGSIYDNAYQLEQKILSAAGGTGGGTTPPPATQNFKGKMVDAVYDDYRKVINSGKLSAEDRIRLTDAMDQWSEIQGRTPASTVTQVGVCTMPSKLKANANLGEQQRHAIDLVTAAINCGILRVVNHGLIPLGDNVGDSREETEIENHEYAHANRTSKVEWGVWRADVVRYYAERLTALKDETGKPLLDSGMVMWTSEYPGFGLHQAHGRTVITVGGAGGRMKTGYHVNGGNAPLSRAHITIMKAYGLSQAEIESKGEVGFGEYSTRPYTGDIHYNGVEWDIMANNLNPKNADFSFDSKGHAKFTGSDVEKRKAFTSYLK